MAGRKNAKPDANAVPNWRCSHAAARDSGRLYRALVENAGDILTLLDGNSIILYQSPATREVLGYNAEPFIGRPVFDGVHPEDRERVQKRFAECVKSPEWVSLETRSCERSVGKECVSTSSSRWSPYH